MNANEQKPASLRRGVFWSLLSFTGARAVTFLAMLVLARLLSPSEFGVLAAVLAFVTLLEMISDLGMKATVIYEAEKGVSSRVQTAFTLNLIFTIALTIVAVALAPLIAQFFGAESETILFRLAALDLLLVGLGNINDALLLRDMDFRRRTIPVVAGSIVRATVTIALAASGLGASALVVGFIAGTAAQTLTLWVVRPFRPDFTVQRAAVRSIVTYGGWASALQVQAAIGQRLDVAVVGGALGSLALGLYTVASRIPELVVGSVAWNLSIVAFPALSQRRDRDDNSLMDTTLNLIRYSALFGVTISAWLAVIAPALVVVLFSSKWAEAGEVMEPLAITFGLACIVFPLGDTFKALGRQPTMVAVNAVFFPAVIGAMLLAAPAGILAVAQARLAVDVVRVVVWFVLISRALDLRLIRTASMLRPALAATAGVVVAGLAVRSALPDPTLGPLIATAAASAMGGALTLYLFARTEFVELRHLVGGRLRGLPFIPKRWAPGPASGAG